MREWKLIADRFRLDAPHGWASILAAATFLLGRGLATPAALAALPAEGLEALCLNVTHDALVRTLWGVARCTFPPPASSSFLIPPHQEFTDRHLVKAIQRRNAHVAKSGGIRVRLPPKLNQKRSFLKLGPMRKIRHRAKADLLPAAITRFLH